MAVPVTVAVKVIEPPRVGAPDATNATVGVALATAVLVVDAVAGTELYALSPGKVKLAP